MRDGAPPLRLEGVSVYGDDGSAVEAFSLRVGRGEAVVLHGPDDFARARLLLVAAGLEVASAGTVSLLGVDPSRADVEELAALRAHMGVVFAKPGLLTNLSLGANVSLPIRIHGNRSRFGASRAALERLEQVGLAPLKEQYPSNLPRGKVRLGALARSLALDPEILFLEEPGLDLDASELEIARATIDAERREHGLAVLATSSFPSSFFAAPTRVVALHGGSPCTTSTA
jgi:ABC-type transporter Mla maintaining outer membrane lipid asymmetry ATPase subunit MlaF